FGCHSISPAFALDRTRRVICAPTFFSTGIKAEPTRPLAPAIATFICSVLSRNGLRKTLPRILTHRSPECTSYLVVFAKKIYRIRAFCQDLPRVLHPSDDRDSGWRRGLMRHHFASRPDAIDQSAPDNQHDRRSIKP